jgi:hypothetical protein
MRANSRSSIRWGVATAVAVAVVLGTAPALAGSDGNGRLVAAHPTALPDDEWQQQAPDFAIDIRETQTTGTGRNANDGDLIRDDSDVASVDGSANDDAGAEPLFGGTY